MSHDSFDQFHAGWKKTDTFRARNRYAVARFAVDRKRYIEVKRIKAPRKKGVPHKTQKAKIRPKVKSAH